MVTRPFIQIYSNFYYPFIQMSNQYTFVYQGDLQPMQYAHMNEYLPFYAPSVSFGEIQENGISPTNIQVPAVILNDSLEIKKQKDLDQMSQEKSSKASARTEHKSDSYYVENNNAKDVRLDFRIQWKNENRNIVPNLINQLISYLLKKIKSQKLVKRIFNHLPHDPNWTEKKFYLYMKKIKESVTHYVNENVIKKFLEIHEPKCQLYDYEEQLFYMSVSRIAIMKFLQDDAVLISLTSNRMSEAKRKIHLIAREALLRKFLELCQSAKS